MKAVLFDRFGEPAEVLRVGDAAAQEPGRNEVCVRMILSPINPSDLLVVRGQYGRLPALPATPGFEGVGIIDAVGPGFFKRLRGLRPGRRVAALNGQGGNWREFVILPARQAVPLADDIPDEQAASFFVNPATALVMIQDVLRVRPGDWLLQTAAGSALGQMVVRLGRRLGFRTINVVRRNETAEELLRLGADEVIATDRERVEDRVRTITKGAGVRFALDAVGGETGLIAVRSLGVGGRMLVYGTLSNQPIPVDPRLLIAGQKRIEGFWLSEWMQAQGVLTILRLFRRIHAMMRVGILTTPVQATYALEHIGEAVRAADKPGRSGKILLKLSPASG
ncbi:MAG: zinc-dependent alcohol dehydrogenase family protein [Planctomycetes bacterium]|nr:zinc-dependent alcohol dehydrogenase family protein [Planctomycetota bacterium]